MHKATILLLAFLAISCGDETITSVEQTADNSIVGTWLYVESGYSNGAEYFTVPIPSDPPQTIIFGGDFSMSSTSMELAKYKYYRLLDDTVTDRQVIALFEVDPGNQPLDLAGLNPTFYTHWKDNDLTLNHRWCIEGCHMKFKRISPVQTK